MVRCWLTKNDANHSNRHAECSGIEFFAFPYQSLYARLGQYHAIVGDIFIQETIKDKTQVLKKWCSNIRKIGPNGETLPSVAYDRFDKYEDAIEFAALKLNELNGVTCSSMKGTQHEMDSIA